MWHHGWTWKTMLIVMLNLISYTHSRTNIVWFYLHEVPTGVEFVETEVSVVVSRGWEDKEQRELNGYKISVWENGKLLERGGGDGCTTMWMYLMPLNCIHLKVVQMVNSMLCIFSTIKRKERKKGISMWLKIRHLQWPGSHEGCVRENLFHSTTAPS